MEKSNLNLKFDEMNIENLDYKKIDFKAGIEIHKQIDSKEKLFSKADSSLEKNELLDKKIIRKLRFSKGENNEIDKAALKEFLKDKYIIYKYNKKIANLYEIDEFPPRKINEEAFEEVLKISKKLNLKFFEKIMVMRKLIVDGSCPSGFQKTALIGINGFIEIEDE